MKNLKNKKNIGREVRMGESPRQRIPQEKPQLHWLILLIWLIFIDPYNTYPDPLLLLLVRSCQHSMHNQFHFRYQFKMG